MKAERTQEKKRRTHARIVEVASRLFRQDGFEATAVDGLMAEAGLTRGGFYAHFRNKAALFAEAIEAAFDESEQNLFGRGLEAVRGEAWVAAAARRYLRWEHRTQPQDGCAAPTLGAEVARAPMVVRRSFNRRLARILDEMAARLGGDEVEARRRAILLLSSWVGALVLARAIPTRSVAEEILEAVRASSGSDRPA